MEIQGNESITQELILKALSLSEQIFLSLIPGYIIGKDRQLVSSVFRSDKIPSMSIYWKGNRQKFIDFGNSEYKGDCIDFVRRYYNLDFNSAVEKIVSDFNSNVPSRKMDSHCLKKISRKDSKPVELDVKSRLYTFEEIQFWNEFGITKDILDEYRVSAVKYIFINKKPILAQPFTFAFKEEFKGQVSYKLYQPKNPENKWLNNHSFKVLQGFAQLPETGELLIVTKSLKDVMCLHSLGYNAIAPQSENSFVKKNVLEDLRKRFKSIIIWYDNDEPGIREAEKFSKQFNLPYIYIPIGEPKDVSDYYFKYKEEQTKKLTDRLLKKRDEIQKTEK